MSTTGPLTCAHGNLLGHCIMCLNPPPEMSDAAQLVSRWMERSRAVESQVAALTAERDELRASFATAEHRIEELTAERGRTGAGTLVSAGRL